MRISDWSSDVCSSDLFFAIQGIPAVLGLGSLYGPDGFSGFQEPGDVRVVNTAYTPFYFAEELQVQARLEQKFGAMTLTATGIYQDTEVDSRQDYFQIVRASCRERECQDV